MHAFLSGSSTLMVTCASRLCLVYDIKTLSEGKTRAVLGRKIVDKIGGESTALMSQQWITK